MPFRVVGVLAAKGQTGFGRDQDDVVIVPITTHQERLTGQTWVNTIYVSASSADVVPGVIDATERLLRLEHHLAPINPDDFTVRNIANVQQVRKRRPTRRPFSSLPLQSCPWWSGGSAS